MLNWIEAKALLKPCIEEGNDDTVRVVINNSLEVQLFLESQK